MQIVNNLVTMCYRSGTELLLLLLFLTFNVMVVNSKTLLYTVANPARGLLNRKKIKIRPITISISREL